MARLRPVCSAFLGLFLWAALPAQLGFAADGKPGNGSPAQHATYVFGFVGGFVRHDEPHHPEVKLVQWLREHYPVNVEAQVFENHKYHDAYGLIRERLDTNHDGRLSPEEKKAARILLFGHSWGAAAVVALARHLEQDGIPVLLTVQIDSVAKYGDDALIPPNVHEAVNFYQTRGWLHGRSKITAADPSRTKILGNFQISYKGRSVDCRGAAWFGRTFTKGHIQIEQDPEIWSEIESLIRTQLPETGVPEGARSDSTSTAESSLR